MAFSFLYVGEAFCSFLILRGFRERGLQFKKSWGVAATPRNLHEFGPTDELGFVLTPTLTPTWTLRLGGGTECLVQKSDCFPPYRAFSMR